MNDTGTIIAVRMRQFGDVLATLGALEAIKARWPARHLAYVVDAHYHRLLEPLAFIDELLPSPPRIHSPGRIADYARYVARVRSLRPSALIDFHGNARSALVSRVSGAPLRVGWDVRGRRHAYTVVEPRAEVIAGVTRPRTSLQSALCLARHLDVHTDDVAPAQIPVTGPDRSRARDRLNRAGVPVRDLESGRVVGLNPGRPYPAKAWPRARFAALARELVAAGRHVVVMWGPGERDAAAEVVAEAGGRTETRDGVTLAPEAQIEELPALVASFAALVTIDSGLKHLAVCARVPTVTLFGSTDPREWHMGYQHDAVLWKGLSCSPCRRRTCPFGAPCMDFAIADVMDAVVAVGEGVA